jgi:CheY-like chemotaxis protein
MRGFNDTTKTVLLVEDFEDSRFMMRRLLEMSGYRVLEAGSGREAVELAKRNCPDLILMDLSLPGLDGLTATRLIRELENMCDVPIIAVSAHDRAEFYSLALAAGCNEYVSKPVDFDTLENVLSRLCPPGLEPAPAHAIG